jgi:hypothetical protein
MSTGTRNISVQWVGTVLRFFLFLESEFNFGEKLPYLEHLLPPIMFDLLAKIGTAQQGLVFIAVLCFDLDFALVYSTRELLPATRLHDYDRWIGFS